MTIKEKVLNAVTELPQNVDFEEILERLYFLYKLETGLQQVQSGNTLKEAGLIGCAEGDSDLSVNYKQYLTESLNEKYSHC